MHLASLAIGRHATGDSIISVTRLIPCAGAQYVTPAEKNMLLCEAAANGKRMKEYGITSISRKPVLSVRCGGARCPGCETRNSQFSTATRSSPPFRGCTGS